MVEVLYYAIPAFVLLLVVEAVSFKIAAARGPQGLREATTRRRA